MDCSEPYCFKVLNTPLTMVTVESVTCAVMVERGVAECGFVVVEVVVAVVVKVSG